MAINYISFFAWIPKFCAHICQNVFKGSLWYSRKVKGAVVKLKEYNISIQFFFIDKLLAKIVIQMGYNFNWK